MCRFGELNAHQCVSQELLKELEGVLILIIYLYRAMGSGFIVIWTLQDLFTKLQTNLYIRGSCIKGELSSQRLKKVGDVGPTWGEKREISIQRGKNFTYRRGYPSDPPPPYPPTVLNTLTWFTILTLSAHPPEGYSSHLVCRSVVLSIDLLICRSVNRSIDLTYCQSIC